MIKKKTETSRNWGGKRDNQLGRPPLAGETQGRHNITCSAEVWAWLQSYGDGNASEGLRRLHREKTEQNC